ncbi:MAG: IS630 transposase-related protein [Paracoccus sp. (in: a-proteobacteria)]
MTYSADFRRHVLLTRDREGLTFLETAERFSVGVASVVRWVKQPEPKSGREGCPRKIDLERLAQDVRERPDAYQSGRAARFGVSQNAICQALKKPALTHANTALPSESR